MRVISSVLLLAAALGLVACGNAAKPTSPEAAPSHAHSQSSAAPSPHAPALSASDSKFASAVQAAMAAHGLTGVTDAQIAGVGEKLCAALKSGASQAMMLSASKQVKSKLGMSPRAFVRLVEKDLCPAYLPQVLIRFSGNGILNSHPFVVNASTVTARYSYNCSSFGQGNFIADMTDGSDDQSIANALGSGGSQTTTLYPADQGSQYHLSVDSECAWSIVLRTG